MGKLGFTDALTAFNPGELICVNQGTSVAMELGMLERLQVRISLFRESVGGFELISLRDYPQRSRDGRF